MAKFFLLSIIIALFSLPARAARIENPRAGLRKALIHIAVYNAAYCFGLLYLYGKSGTVHALFLAGIVVLFRFI